MRKTSYDSRQSFSGTPEKKLLPAGTHLYRLVPLTTGMYFGAVWWMPESVFTELHDDANRSAHGGGRLLRNYIARFMALPSPGNQPCVAEASIHEHSG